MTLFITITLDACPSFSASPWFRGSLRMIHTLQRCASIRIQTSPNPAPRSSRGEDSKFNNLPIPPISAYKPTYLTSATSVMSQIHFPPPGCYTIHSVGFKNQVIGLADAGNMGMPVKPVCRRTVDLCFPSSCPQRFEQTQCRAESIF